MNSKETKLASIGIGEVLSEVFSTYFNRFKTLVLIATLCFVVPTLLTLVSADSVFLNLIATIISIVASLVFVGFIVFVVKDARDNTDSSLGDILNKVAPHLGSLFIAVILKSIIIVIGFIFLIIPGIYLAIRLALTEAAVVNEGLGPIKAIKRSFEMTHSIAFRTFLIALVFFLIMLAGFIVGGIILIIITLITSLAGDAAAMIISTIGALVLSVIFQSLGALWAPIVYFRLLDSKEDGQLGEEDSQSETGSESDGSFEPLTEA
jgi:hypothetical protein